MLHVWDFWGQKSRIQPLIDKSLEIIRCCEKNSNNAADSPCFIAVDLLQVWGVLIMCLLKNPNFIKFKNFSINLFFGTISRLEYYLMFSRSFS